VLPQFEGELPRAGGNLINTVLSIPAQESFRIQTDKKMYPQVLITCDSRLVGIQFLEIEDCKDPSSKGFHGGKQRRMV